MRANFEHDGRYFVSPPSLNRANSLSWLRSENFVHLSRQFVRKQAGWHPIFFRAFAKDSLINNIFEKEKNFDNRTRFFLENSSVLGVFWRRRGLQANHGIVGKSAKSPQPGNQKQVKWINTVYFNKRSFKFKIKFCVFQVTEAKFCMKVIRIFNAQPVKIPILRARFQRSLKDPFHDLL